MLRIAFTAKRAILNVLPRTLCGRHLKGGRGLSTMACRGHVEGVVKSKGFSMGVVSLINADGKVYRISA